MVVIKRLLVVCAVLGAAAVVFAQSAPTASAIFHVICDSGCAGAPGAGGDGAILDGVSTAIRATVTGALALKVDGSAVTQPVSGAFWQATQPISGSVSVSNFPATQPVSGTFWQATQAVSIASMPSTPVTGTFWQATQPVSGTFWQATQPVSLAAVPVHDVGTITTAIVPGTGATNLGKAEDAGAVSGDTGVFGLLVRKDTNATLTSADGDYVQQSGDNYGTTFVRLDHPNRIRCTVTTSTATTITAVGGSCAAPGAGLSIYVTDIMFSSSAAGIAADAFPTLKYGTGGTCGTGVTVFWGALTAAAIRTADNFHTPIKIPANNEICWITTTAGSKFLVIGGFIAP